MTPVVAATQQMVVTQPQASAALERIKNLVLDSVRSPHTRRVRQKRADYASVTGKTNLNLVLAVDLKTVGNAGSAGVCRTASHRVDLPASGLGGSEFYLPTDFTGLRLPTGPSSGRR